MAEEKQTQNSEVQVLAYTPRVARAIDAILAPLGYSSTARKGLRGRSSLTDMLFGGSGGSYEYNGMFKLKMIFPYQNQKRVFYVEISDSQLATQYCRVNNTTYAMPDVRWISDDYTDTGEVIYFKLKFTPPLTANTTPVEIVADTKLIDENDKSVWILLGRLIRHEKLEDGAPYIVQDFQNGIPQLLWFEGCTHGDDY